MNIYNIILLILLRKYFSGFIVAFQKNMDSFQKNMDSPIVWWRRFPMELIIMMMQVCWETWHHEELTALLYGGADVISALAYVIKKNPTGNLSGFRTMTWVSEFRKVWGDNIRYLDFTDRTEIPPFLGILAPEIQHTYIGHWNKSFAVCMNHEPITFLNLLNSGAFGLIHHMLKTGYRFELESFKTGYGSASFIMPRFHHDVLTDDEKILIMVSHSVFRQYKANKKDYFFQVKELEDLLRYLATTCGKNYNPIWIRYQMQLMTCVNLKTLRSDILERDFDLDSTRRKMVSGFPKVYDFEGINADDYMYLCKYCLEKPLECRCICTSCQFSVNDCTCYCFKCNSRLRPFGYGTRFEKEEEVMGYTICKCDIPVRNYSLWSLDNDEPLLENLFS